MHDQYLCKQREREAREREARKQRIIHKQQVNNTQTASKHHNTQTASKHHVNTT
jgi:hypothetical protein